MEIKTKNIKIGKFRNTTISLPLLGVGEGEKKALIICGMHGDEFTGLSVINSLLEQIKDQNMAGKLAILPIANPLAVLACQRETVLENLDLNRSFKFEDAQASFTQKIAEKLLDFSQDFDFVIDLHTFADPTGITAIFMDCGDKILNEETLPLIKLTNPDVIWRLDVKEDSSMLGSFGPLLASKGIKNMALEMPDHRVITCAQLERVVSGIKNILVSLKILQSNNALPAPETKIPIVNFNKIVSDYEGLFVSAVALQQHVIEGEKLGEVVDITTQKRFEVISPKKGIVFIAKNRDFVTVGDRLAVVGEILREV